MDLAQNMDVLELIDRLYPMSKEEFLGIVDCHCLVIELSTDVDDDSSPILSLPHRDTLEAGDGFRRSAPRKGDQRVIFFRKCDAAFKGMFSVGRSSDCDLTIPHMSVSKRHALIEVRKGGFYITDPSSRNGTFVDGRRLDPSHPTRVRSSDTIRFGDVPTYFFSPGDLYSYLAVIDRAEKS
jgi:hypothetical protein